MTPDLNWLRALNEPEVAGSWSLPQWQRVIRLARRLRMAARLAEATEAAGLDAQLPDPVPRHLLAERRLSRHRLRALRWAMLRVRDQLGDLPFPCVLLKGGAYVAQGLPIAPGRLPADLDMMVPREAIPHTLDRLKDHGWREVDLDDHDRRYYEQWSHEVPPLHHPEIGLELDLHHGILPPVARTTVDPRLLLGRLHPSGVPGWQVLAPVDQVLHAAAHLVLDSDLTDRLRDLVDLDALMRHFARHPAFWDDLCARSRELGLAGPMALVVDLCTRWLGTPMPDATRRTLLEQGPGPLRRAGLTALLESVLWPAEPDEPPSARRKLAAGLWLARYHWGRLPLHLLLPHLWQKARVRRAGDNEGDDRL